jgi:hypothetical protein
MSLSSSVSMTSCAVWRYQNYFIEGVDTDTGDTRNKLCAVSLDQSFTSDQPRDQQSTLSTHIGLHKPVV